MRTRSIVLIVLMLMSFTIFLVGMGMALYQLKQDNLLELYIMNDKVSDGAVCLDGSPAGYYYRNGGSDILQIHLEGGGWCYDEEDCFERAHGGTGSSAHWDNKINHHGMIDDTCHKNQALCHANVVYIPYCDGGSFTGDRTVPLQWKGNDLHFKGRRILIAALESALSRGLMNVPYILISGDSAGGLAVELNVNLINSWIQSNVPGVKRIMAISSSGFFPNVNNAAGFPQYATLMQNVFSMNEPDITATNCSYLGTDDEWRCMFAQNLIPHITIPFFLQQSQVDAWVLSCIYAAYLPYNFPNETSSTNGNCSSIPNIGACADNTEMCTDAHVESINTFMENMKLTVSSTGIEKAGNGLFMHTCKSHSGLIKTEWYKHIKVNGVVMDEALREWLKNFRTDELLPSMSFIDPCKWNAAGTPRNCNPTCGDDNKKKSGIDKIIHDIYHNDLDANPDLAKGVVVALFGLLFMFLVLIVIIVVCCCCKSPPEEHCSSNEMAGYATFRNLS